MSLIHWDKSVLSFHLKEIIEDHHKGNTNALVGLGAILVGTTVLPAAAKLGRPILKTVIKSGLSIYEEGKSSLNSTEIKSSFSPNAQPLNPIQVNQKEQTRVEVNH